MYTKEQLADMMEKIIGFLDTAEAATAHVMDPAHRAALEALTQAVAGVALIVCDVQGLRKNKQDED